MTSIKPTAITDYLYRVGLSNKTQMPEETARFVIVMAIAGKQDASNRLIKTASLPSNFTR